MDLVTSPPIADIGIDAEKLAYAIEIRRGRKSLAEAAAEIGISVTTLHEVQVGKKRIGLLNMLRVCRWLDKPVEYFLREVTA